MKNNEVKSFTFQVAKQNETNSQWRATEGSAKACGNGGSGWDGCGGCTLVDYGWGREPMTNLGTGGDGPVWC